MWTDLVGNSPIRGVKNDNSFCVLRDQEKLILRLIKSKNFINKMQCDIIFSNIELKLCSQNLTCPDFE